MTSNQSIAELAYQLWDARGRTHDSAEEDWLEAERQLATAEKSYRVDSSGDGSGDGSIDSSLKASFPASDPPASHLPDLPPSNASDKWVAAGKRPPAKSTSSSKKASISDSKRRRAGFSGVAAPPADETDDAPATAPGDTGGD